MGASISSRRSRTNTRAIAEATPVAVSSPADLYFTSEFRILDLSTDVLTLALNSLNDESLTSVRRTCKALDRVTFDRFADHYFAHIYCWNYTTDGFERLRDIILHSSRLRDRIRRVTLTDDFFEDLAVTSLQFVPKENQSDEWAKIWSIQAYLNTCYDSSTRHILMHRVLKDLQRLPQKVLIDVDFIHHDAINPRSRDGYNRRTDLTLFSLITSQTKVHSLAIEEFTFELMDEILAHDRAELMACMSAIETLKFTVHFWPPLRPFFEHTTSLATDILRSAEQLRNLTFDVALERGKEVCTRYVANLLNVPSEILQVGHYSNLKTLKLVHFAVSEDDLSRVLRQCRATLTHLNLWRVRLTSGYAGWRRIGEILLQAQLLAFLQLQIMYTSDEPYRWWKDPWSNGLPYFPCSEVKDGNPPGIILNGRDNVVFGAERLAEMGVSMFEQLD